MTHKTYRVATRISADQNGRTTYPGQEDVTPVARLIGRGAYARNGKWYYEVSEVEAANVEDGDVVVISHGGARNLIELYDRDGDAESGQVAGNCLYRVESKGRAYDGKARLYGHELCLVPADLFR